MNNPINISFFNGINHFMLGSGLPTENLLAYFKDVGGTMVDSVGISSSLGVDGEFDYFIATSGDDEANGESISTAWASLEKIGDITIPVGGSIRIFISSGTYDKSSDKINLSSCQAAGATLDIVFDRGCLADGTNAGAVGFYEAPGTSAWTVNIFANGLVVQGYKDATEITSPNGFGNRGENITNIYDASVIDCNDGFSAHDNATLTVHRCIASLCLKGAYVNVDTSKFEAYNSVFTGAVGSSSLGGGGNFGTGAHYLEDCTLIPSAPLAAFQPKNTTLLRCRVGTLTADFQLATGTTYGSVFTDCFINCYMDGNHIVSFNSCFGMLSIRVRAGGSFVLNHSVIVGPSSSKTSLLQSNYDFSGSSPFTFNNNVFAGSWTFDSLDTTTNADYIFSAGSEFNNNILYGGTAYSARILTAGGSSIAGTITDDPMIGDADSFKMSDYAFGSGSPAHEAGYGGGDIGFSTTDSDNRHIDKTLKLTPVTISGSDISDYVLKWSLSPELLLSDDGTIYTNYVPNEIDLSTFTDSAWMRFGDKGGVIYSVDQDAETIVEIDKSIGNHEAEAATMGGETVTMAGESVTMS